MRIQMNNIWKKKEKDKIEEKEEGELEDISGTKQSITTPQEDQGTRVSLHRASKASHKYISTTPIPAISGAL